jgi:hypothetical protein
MVWGDAAQKGIARQLVPISSLRWGHAMLDALLLCVFVLLICRKLCQHYKGALNRQGSALCHSTSQ